MAKWGIPEKNIKNVAQRRWPKVCRTLQSKVMAKLDFFVFSPAILHYEPKKWNCTIFPLSDTVFKNCSTIRTLSPTKKQPSLFVYSKSVKMRPSRVHQCTSLEDISIFSVKGELVTRGYSTMLGYWGDKTKTEEVIGQDRWFHTGWDFLQNNQLFHSLAFTGTQPWLTSTAMDKLLVGWRTWSLGVERIFIQGSIFLAR